MVLLQITQSPDTLNNLLRKDTLQGNWLLILLVTTIVIIIVAILWRKRKVHSQIPVPKFELNPSDDIGKTIEASTVNDIPNQSPISILSPSNNKPVKDIATQVQLRNIAGEPIQVLQKELIQPTKDKTNVVTPLNVAPIAQSIIKDQSVPKYIGYDPTKISECSEPLSFPYIVLPKANSAITLPQNGRIGRQGYKDADFKKYLDAAFSNIVQLDDNSLISVKNGAVYSPDITLIDTQDGLNLFIDIEIDEPYEGVNDITSRKPLHYTDSDIIRNNAISDNGWVVIRFAEIQVHKSPEACCQFIAGVISKINPNFKIPIALNIAEKLNPVGQWSKEDAIVMSNERYREKYLGINLFGSSIFEEGITDFFSSTPPIHKLTDTPIVGTQNDTDKSHATPPHRKYIDPVQRHEINNKAINYETIIIGKQEWMTSNLNADCYSDGTPIPEVKDEKEWELYGKNGIGCWCYADNNPENGAKYGKLYNWYAVVDERKIAPDGWRVPNRDDYEKLGRYFPQVLLMQEKKADYFEGWNYKSSRNCDGSFKRFRINVGNRGSLMGCWWCFSDKDSENAYYCSNKYVGEKYGNYEYFKVDTGIKGSGIALRCVKDLNLPSQPNTFEAELVIHKNGLKCGMCDKENKIIIPCIYDWITYSYGAKTVYLVTNGDFSGTKTIHIDNSNFKYVEVSSGQLEFWAGV
jgi:uncharacterized protein (TIGR02145 family)